MDDGTIMVKDEGPPLRPVCDISDGVSHKLSYLLSNIIDEVCNGETVCTSTEEMLASINKCNNNGIQGEDVLGSADVKSLYPSIPVDEAIDIVVEEFEKKKMKIEGLDYEELGLYLALNMEPAEITRIRLKDVCPTRAHSSRKPEITCSGIKVNKKERFEPWNKATKIPDDEEKIKMLIEALRIGIKVIMKNHTYEFANLIKKQREGGPIGMDLTGTIAKIFMKWWDERLLEKLEEAGIEKKMYERYVDDVNMCIKETPIGARYIDGKLEYPDGAKEEDEEIPADKRTFTVVMQKANSIQENIQVEIDVPTNYTDCKLPILDLKVWIEKVETKNGEELKIVHQHYVKPMAKKYVIHKDAAMSFRNKRTILTQMCLRVMLNNSVYLKREQKKITVEFFLKRMQASGYDEKFRYQVLKSALQAYKEIESNPIRPLYRGKEMNTPQERIKRRRKRRNWFRGGGYESVMFIPATPGSELTRRIQEEVAVSELKIKVVEKPGIKIKRMLQRNNTVKSMVCADTKCFIFSSSKQGNCRKTGVTYSITCRGNCGGDQYYGETNCNGYTRGIEHLNDYNYRRANSVMWKHCQKEHNGEEQQFEMKIIDYVKNDPTKRQILEAVRINSVNENRRINDKKEWVVGRIPTMTISEL